MGKCKRNAHKANINENIAKILTLHRIWNGYTQSQIAKCVEVTFQQIQKYERCINRIPGDHLIDICKQKSWDIQLFTNDKPEAIFEEWCKSVDISKIDSPYPLRADQIQRSWDKIEEVGEQNYYNEHSPRYKNIIKEMRGD